MSYGSITERLAFTSRLWTALLGFAGILLVLKAGNRLFGAPAGASGRSHGDRSGTGSRISRFTTPRKNLAIVGSSAGSKSSIKTIPVTAREDLIRGG